MSLEIKHGDSVTIRLQSASYIGRVEQRMVGLWPDKREALYICIEGHFPYRQRELEAFGATIEVNR